MSRRGDNIHKRKDGRWEGRYISGGTTEGKAIYKSVYSASFSECSEKLKLAKCGLLPQSKPITVSELFNAWSMNRKNTVKKSTYVNYNVLFKNILNLDPIHHAIKRFYQVSECLIENFIVCVILLRPNVSKTVLMSSH